MAAVLNFTAMLLCFYLVIKGKTSPEDARDNDKEKLNYPMPYLFFAGKKKRPLSAASNNEKF